MDSNNGFDQKEQFALTMEICNKKVQEGEEKRGGLTTIGSKDHMETEGDSRRRGRGGNEKQHAKRHVHRQSLCIRKKVDD